MMNWSIAARLPASSRSRGPTLAYIFATALISAHPGLATAQEQPTTGPDVAADAAQRETLTPPETKDRYGLTAELIGTYTDNLYRVQRRREDDFDRNQPGEQFYEMEGPGDFVTEASVAPFHKWDLGEGRDAKASIAAGYAFHVQNAIANYFFIEGSGGYDVSRDDTLSVEAEIIPRRFKKNYSIRDDAFGNRFYEHAYYWEIEPAVGWRHEWTERWKTDLAYEVGVRRYLAPFSNRDTTWHGPELIVSHDFGRVEVGLGAGAAFATTPSGLEFGVPVDRSYNDVRMLAEGEVNLPAGWSVGAEAEYRIRNYTTDEPANDTYFERTDQRWTFTVEGKKRFGEVFSLLVLAGLVDNATNRQDHPNVDPTDLGYEELFLGIGAEATF